MYSRLSAYWPTQYHSVEDTFKVHYQVHGPTIMNMVNRVIPGGVQKYVVGRVTEVHKGMPLFTNTVQLWWETEEAMRRYGETLKGEKVYGADEFDAMTVWGMTAYVDEKIVYEKSDSSVSEEEAPSRLSVYWSKHLAEVVDVFNYHANVHAPKIMEIVDKACPGAVKKYLIGRVTEVARLRPLFTNYCQLWWESKEAERAYTEALKNHGKIEGDELDAMTIWGFTAFVEEKIIYEKK